MPIGTNSFRVLIIDDDPMSLRVLKILLNSLGAEHIVAVGGVAEARGALQADPTLRLIVTDHYMKDGCGVRLLANVRQGLMFVPNDTYVIISTSSSNVALAAVAMSLHVDSFMTKPFSKEQLARRLYDFMTNEKRTIEPPEYFQQMKVDEMILAAEIQDPVFDRVPHCHKEINPVMTPLHKVFPDAILTADLVGDDGNLLLRAGTTLSRNMLKRLGELHIKTVPVGTG